MRNQDPSRSRSSDALAVAAVLLVVGVIVVVTAIIAVSGWAVDRVAVPKERLAEVVENIAPWLGVADRDSVVSGYSLEDIEILTLRSSEATGSSVEATGSLPPIGCVMAFSSVRGEPVADLLRKFTSDVMEIEFVEGAPSTRIERTITGRTVAFVIDVVRHRDQPMSLLTCALVNGERTLTVFTLSDSQPQDWSRPERMASGFLGYK